MESSEDIVCFGKNCEKNAEYIVSDGGGFYCHDCMKANLKSVMIFKRVKKGDD